MKSKLIHAGISLIVFAGLAAILVALTWRPDTASAVVAEHDHAHEQDECCPDEAAASTASHEDEHDHDHGDHDEPADLDTLMARQCEHEVSIVACDECRYEAGVAKMGSALADGLVETHVVHAEQQSVHHLKLTGEVQLDLTRVVEVASAGSGRVEELKKMLGDMVRPSDVLAVIQSSEFGQAQAGFLEAQARLDLANRTSEREKQLHEQKISSEADYLAARNELTTAQASLAAARKRLQLFGLSEPQIEAFAGAEPDVTFGQLVLTAPLGGVIIEQNVVRGRLVDTTDTLFQIADLGRVWVWCDVYEADLAALHERLTSGERVQAEIHAGAFPQTVFEGTLDLIGSQVDRQTRTVKVRLLADNPEGKLRPGMFVKVSLGLNGTESVVRVPETAVLSDEGQHFVFARLTDDLWIRRHVTVGPARDGVVEIHAGLAEGDTVAVKGAFMFKSEVLKEKMGAGCAH